MSTHPVSRRLLHTLWNVPSSALDSGVTRLGVCGDVDTLQLITRGIVWKVERDEMAAWENFFLILLRCLKEELIATSESGHSLVIYVCPKFGHDCLYWCVKVLLPTDMHTTANSILARNCLSCFFFFPQRYNLKFSSLRDTCLEPFFTNVTVRWNTFSRSHTHRFWLV